MPKNQPTAAQRARRLQAAKGGRYTDILHGLATSADESERWRADDWLQTVLAHLQELGWPGSPLDLEFGQYHAYPGPVQLQVARDVDDVDAQADDADPDDPRWAQAPLWLGVLAPHEATVDDLETGARAGAETPQQIAARVDAELAQARLRLVQAAEPDSTTSCPICGDRYAVRHLLATSAEGDAVCPACVWDADQRWKADLPYLAVRIDRLLREDLSAPAGWAAVAALLALTCGANLGRRLERELQRRGGFPLVMEWWNQPLERSWIWLPPRERRHPAFARLGAGASLAAIIEALERHDPTLRTQAQRLCRDAEVRWRPALLPAAVAYAVAFTAQAAERDRHRKPVHVVDSTSDGLSQLRSPFAVAGDASNVEAGLEVLLEYLLFPLLLGHGLRDTPPEPRRVYSAEPEDDRPARSRSDARVTHEVNRASQVAVVLGQIPGVPNAQVIWDGSACPVHDDAPLGATSPVNSDIDEARQAARIQVAGQMYDDAGPSAMIADEAWARAGLWIPADDGAHAIRQARDFLADRPHVDVLWGGHDGALSEPMWIGVQVIEVNERGTGIGDVPGLHVLRGESLFGMRLSDIALVRRAEPAPINAGSALADNEDGTRYDTAYVIDPTAEQAWRLVGHKIHQLAHDHPRSWRALDHLASKCRERLWTLPTEHGQDVTVQLWLRLTDTEVDCDDPSCQARTMYLTGDGTGDGGQVASGPLPEFARTRGLAYFTFTTHPHGDAWAASKDPQTCTWMYTALALYGGFMRVNWMDFAAPDAVTSGYAAWKVRDFQETEIRRVVITSGPDGISQTETGAPDYAWPSLPPEVAAELEQRSPARQAR